MVRVRHRHGRLECNLKKAKRASRKAQVPIRSGIGLRKCGCLFRAELYNLKKRFFCSLHNPIQIMLLRPKFLAGILCSLIFTGTAGLAMAAGEDEDLARKLLMEALDNQYRGRYQATLETINENFSEGRDSLVGWAEFSDEVGERRICLAGSRRAFEYHSLDFGKEQWITDDNSQRIRRIANRQWRKGVFGNLLTYEDMLKMPSDFFLDYSSCKGVTVTDSTYNILMTLKHIYQSFYGRIDVTLSKNPVLLRALTFYGTHGEKLKTLDVQNYMEMNGKWLVTDMTVTDTDSLS